MLFEELLKDEYSAGKKEGLVEGRTEGVVQSMICILSAKGKVSDELCAKLQLCSNMEQLLALVNFATKAESVSVFEAELDNMVYMPCNDGKGEKR
jgi:hypothetical protein